MLWWTFFVVLLISTSVGVINYKYNSTRQNNKNNKGCTCVGGVLLRRSPVAMPTSLQPPSKTQYSRTFINACISFLHLWVFTTYLNQSHVLYLCLNIFLFYFLVILLRTTTKFNFILHSCVEMPE